MKNCIITLATLLVVASCQKKTEDNCSLSAAKNIYNQYSAVDGLTVALIGNHISKGDTINAVMLQANSYDTWIWLLNEFDMPQTPAQTVKVSSAAITYFHADTTVGDMDDYFDELMKGILPNVPHHDSNITVTNRQSWVNGVKVSDSTVADTTTGFAPNRKLMNAAIGDKQTGYLVNSESEEMTIWLFFYENKAQFRRITNRLNKE
ncbi:MAG: hypothetical protein J5711_09765 [Bacteroidales bacterium]|nr:hypothetical protein [Bacteroidales bacterium]